MFGLGLLLNELCRFGGEDEPLFCELDFTKFIVPLLLPVGEVKINGFLEFKLSNFLIATSTGKFPN